MTQLKKLIETEIFNNPKKRKNIVNNLQLLFTSLNENKEVLTFVEDYFEKNIVNNKKFNSSEKSKISNLLKKVWIKAWLAKSIDSSDLEIIKKYFNRYTSAQQKKLNQKINYLKKGQSQFEVKEESVLTDVLKKYRDGKPKFLEDYVSSQKILSYADAKRIINLMDKNLLNNTLPIFTQALEKSKSIFTNIDINIDYLCFLNQPFSDTKKFTNELIKKYKSSIYDTNYCNEKLIKTLTSIDILDKESFLVSVGDFFIYLSHFSPERIEQTLKNTDEILISNKYFKKWIMTKFKIESSGIKSIIDSLKVVEEKYKKISIYLNLDDPMTVGEFMNSIKNVSIIYQNYKMNEIFKDKEDSLETQNKRIKI